MISSFQFYPIFDFLLQSCVFLSAKLVSLACRTEQLGAKSEKPMEGSKFPSWIGNSENCSIAQRKFLDVVREQFESSTCDRTTCNTILACYHAHHVAVVLGLRTVQFQAALPIIRGKADESFLEAFEAASNLPKSFRMHTCRVIHEFLSKTPLPREIQYDLDPIIKDAVIAFVSTIIKSSKDECGCDQSDVTALNRVETSKEIEMPVGIELATH